MYHYAIQETTDKIRKLLNKLHIETIFTNSESVGETLPTPNNRNYFQSEWVYKNLCAVCMTECIMEEQTE